MTLVQLTLKVIESNFFFQHYYTIMIIFLFGIWWGLRIFVQFWHFLKENLDYSYIQKDLLSNSFTRFSYIHCSALLIDLLINRVMEAVETIQLTFLTY